MYNGSGNTSRDVVKNMFLDTKPNPCPLTLLWILSLYPSCGITFPLIVYKSFKPMIPCVRIIIFFFLPPLLLPLFNYYYHHY